MSQDSTAAQRQHHIEARERQRLANYKIEMAIIEAAAQLIEPFTTEQLIAISQQPPIYVKQTLPRYPEVFEELRAGVWAFAKRGTDI